MGSSTFNPKSPSHHIRTPSSYPSFPPKSPRLASVSSHLTPHPHLSQLRFLLPIRRDPPSGPISPRALALPAGRGPAYLHSLGLSRPLGRFSSFSGTDTHSSPSTAPAGTSVRVPGTQPSRYRKWPGQRYGTRKGASGSHQIGVAMLDTVGPLPIIKPRSHLQNSNSASETPICGPYPCPSWRKAIRRERHYSQEHETSHLPIRMGHTLL